MARRIAIADGRMLPSAADRALVAFVLGVFPDGAAPHELVALPDFPGPLAAGPTGRASTRELDVLTGVPALAVVLDLDVDELLHLARWARPATDDGPRRTRHYTYSVRPQRDGKVRVIEAPKPRLKEIQRRVGRRLLCAFEPHPAARGSARGRGVVGAIAEHAAADVVICLDIERFFPSVTATRVAGLFRSAGAETRAAAVLARLVTTAVPRDVRRTLPPLPGATSIERTWRRDRDLAVLHLPQGAPTSPALADTLCRGLDRRLAGLAAHRGLRYTRYVDDLTLSGPLTDLDPRAVVARVESIVRDEGFRVADHKTRVQRSAGRQRVLGAVVNAHPTLTRTERDALKATVHNCRVHGWRTQLHGGPADGFRERLTGRVSWLAALDPVRGRRLRAELDAVDWT